MFYITGDTHRDFRRTAAFCDTVESSKDDVLIILGDAGINYFGGEKDRALKRQLADFPITLLCVHGNHEQRPEMLGYAQTAWNGGTVYWEPDFPNLLFAKDGEIYNINGKRYIVIGGAYSIDKPLRISEGWGWWADEQPSAEIRERVEARLDAEGWRVDVVLSHTCPLKYEPREAFINSICQAIPLWINPQRNGLTALRTDYSTTAGTAVTTIFTRRLTGCGFYLRILSKLNKPTLKGALSDKMKKARIDILLFF